MKIMVLGAGTMGAGIAQVALQAGLQVIMRDLKPEYVERGIAIIERNLEKAITKQRITTEDKAQMLSKLTTTTDLNLVKDCDLVIEAALENMEIKKQIFEELDSLAKPECILATNTSSLSITEISMATKRPDKVIGMHFFNPVPSMKLIEIIKGVLTSTDTYNTVKELSLKLEKKPVEVNEFPGFVVNRILFPMLNEAMYTLMEGVANVEDIDTALKLGAGHPLGPLEVADLVGLDICLAIMQTLHREFGDSKYRPCPLLIKMVRANKLGRKTGEGFYKY